jgi:hypothetical protein
MIHKEIHGRVRVERLLKRFRVDFCREFLCKESSEGWFRRIISVLSSFPVCFCSAILEQKQIILCQIQNVCIEGNWSNDYLMEILQKFETQRVLQKLDESDKTLCNVPPSIVQSILAGKFLQLEAVIGSIVKKIT